MDLRLATRVTGYDEQARAVAIENEGGETGGIRADVGGSPATS